MLNRRGLFDLTNRCFLNIRLRSNWWSHLLLFDYRLLLRWLKLGLGKMMMLFSYLKLVVLIVVWVLLAIKGWWLVILLVVVEIRMRMVLPVARLFYLALTHMLLVVLFMLIIHFNANFDGVWRSLLNKRWDSFRCVGFWIEQWGIIVRLSLTFLLWVASFVENLEVAWFRACWVITFNLQFVEMVGGWLS